MEIAFDLLDGVLRVRVRGRETAEETRELAERIFAERERTGALAILAVPSESRALFKVEEYGLSAILQRMKAIPGLRMAAVSTESELRASLQYVELLASQQDVAYRAFTKEAEALEWLRGDIPVRNS